MALGRRPSSQLFFPFLLSFEVVLVVLFVAGPSPAAASKELLQKTCNQTVISNKGACNKYLLNSGWALSCGDTKCLAAKIVPELAKPKTVDGRFNVLRLALKLRLEELMGCVEDYNHALNSLVDAAQQAAGGGGYAQAAQYAASAEVYIHSCENRFGRTPTPVTSTNNEVADIINLTRSVIGLNA